MSADTWDTKRFMQGTSSVLLDITYFFGHHVAMLGGAKMGALNESFRESTLGQKGTNNRKMRVVYLSTFYHDDLGAFSGTNRRIYDALSQLNGYEVIYYRASANPIISFLVRAAGWATRLLFGKDFQTGLGERLFPSICRRTLRWLQRNPCDLIIAWQLSFGRVFEKFDGAKVFFSDSTYHAIVPYYNWTVTKRQFSRIDLSQMLLLKCSDQFWCFSSFFTKDAELYYKVNSTKIRRFRFFPTPTFAPVHQESETTLPIRLLLVGTNYYDKGVPIAASATYLLNHKYHVAARLEVVGVSELTPFEYVTFHGRVSQFNSPDRFWAFFENADIFFMPTRHECAGIVFAEAAYYGLPSVSYFTGGVSDYVSDGESGYLLAEGSSADAFAELIFKRLSTREQRRAMGLAARAFYERTMSQERFLDLASECLGELFSA